MPFRDVEAHTRGREELKVARSRDDKFPRGELFSYMSASVRELAFNPRQVLFSGRKVWGSLLLRYAVDFLITFFPSLARLHVEF